MKRIILLIIFIIFITYSTNILISQQSKFQYFFYVPSFDNRMYIIITGLHESTHYTLYNITEMGLKTKFLTGALNKYDVVYYNLSEGFYLLETDKRVSAVVRIGDKPFYDTYTYHISVDGTVLGNEFIFTSLQTASIVVLAYEDSKVELYDTSGRIIQKMDLVQNSSALLKTLSGKTYRVVSSGRIALIEAFGKTPGEKTLRFITPENCLKGKWLMTYYVPNPAVEGFIIVFPYSPGKVRILYGSTNKLVAEHVFSKEDIEKNRYWIVKTRFKSRPLKIISEGNVSAIAMSGSQWREFVLENVRGLDLLDLPANEEIKVFALTKIVIFTPYESEVTVNNIKFESGRGGYLVFTGERIYSIKANKPILVEIINNIHTDGFSLISQKDVGVRLSPVKRSTAKMQGGINPLMIGIIIVILVIVLALLFYKLKAKK